MSISQKGGTYYLREHNISSNSAPAHEDEKYEINHKERETEPFKGSVSISIREVIEQGRHNAGSHNDRKPYPRKVT
jgi:hypothetical protein